jgi:hypothetical protein
MIGNENLGAYLYITGHFLGFVGMSWLTSPLCEIMDDDKRSKLHDWEGRC